MFNSILCIMSIDPLYIQEYTRMKFIHRMGFIAIDVSLTGLAHLIICWHILIFYYEKNSNYEITNYLEFIVINLNSYLNSLYRNEKVIENIL